MAGNKRPSNKKNKNRTSVSRQVVRASPSGAVHKFIRSSSSESWIPVLTATSAGGAVNLANDAMLTLSVAPFAGFYFGSVGIGFSLSSLPGYTDFTSLFDQYRIERVDVVLQPILTVAPTQAPGANGAVGGIVHSVVDFDDNAAIAASVAGLHSMQQYETYKLQPLVTEHALRWSIVPRLAVSTYGGGAFTSYANQVSWIDANSPNVEHYGLKLVFEVFNPTSAITYVNMKLSATYHVSARAVR